MKKYLYRILIFIFFIPIYSNAQQNWCGTDEYNEKLLKQMTEADRNFAQAMRNKIFENASVSNSKSGTVYTIPVVVHVIHDNCDGNISLEQIEDGIRVMNEDYRRLNSDTSNTRSLFKPVAADIEIQFQLAKIDPNGKCTEGVVRINSPLTHEARDNVKSLSYWPSNKYLNIWLVKSIQGSGGGLITLGYAQFPGFGSWSTYGVVARSDYWGTIGTSHDDGRVATHEVGHCLGLYHTFQSGCGGSCTSSGDRICDTPPAYQATFSCNKSQNTCSNDASGGSTQNPNPYSSNVVDQIENYMSYDDCTNMFTAGQRAVMRATLNNFSQLSNLVSSSNLIATGTNPGYQVQTCAPKADYCQESKTICEGKTVTYTDQSYNGPATSRTWSFPGGSPSSSSDSVVTVTYNTAGKYGITLSVSNASGTTSKNNSTLVTVVKDAADFSTWKYEENFENITDFNQYWTIKSNEGKAWELTTKAAYTGDKSIYIYNYINSVSGTLDELISPSYDLSAIYSPRLIFKVAYAQKSASSADLLRIYYSYTCGENWSVMNIQNSAALNSAQGFVNSSFEPADQSQWKEVIIPISSFIASKKNVRFKFEFVAGLGNNIYMDDINISSITGIDEVNLSDRVKVYPNPVSDILTIEFPSDQMELNHLILRDIAGRQVLYENISGSAGSNVKIDVSGLNSGIYFLQMQTSGGQQVVKKVRVR